MVHNKIHILEEEDDRSIVGNGSFLTGDFKARVNNTTIASEDTEKPGLIIDRAAYIVFLNGLKIAFPKKEFELLLLLASNPRKVFKRSEILQQIWGVNFRQKDSRSLDVHIRMIRKKLGDLYITTIRGVGYKLEK